MAAETVKLVENVIVPVAPEMETEPAPPTWVSVPSTAPEVAPVSAQSLALVTSAVTIPMMLERSNTTCETETFSPLLVSLKAKSSAPVTLAAAGEPVTRQEGGYREGANSAKSVLRRSDATAVWSVRSAVINCAPSSLARAR